MHWAPLPMEFRIWCGTIHCDIDILQNKADFRIRLHAKKVFVRGLEFSQSLPISGSWSCHFVHCSPRLKLLGSY